MMQNEKTPQKDKLSARTVKIQLTVFDLMALLMDVEGVSGNQNLW